MIDDFEPKLVFDSFYSSQSWEPLPYQKQTLRYFFRGYNGIVNAPTGTGKTYSLLLPIFLKGIQLEWKKGLIAIWVSPLRAITAEIKQSAERLVDFLDLDWEVAIRTGDSSTKERAQQLKKPPQLLITTPESLHLIIASKAGRTFFKNIRYLVVDEWHELLGSKRGVLLELAAARIKNISKRVKIWGISATIGNMEQAMEVLLGYTKHSKKAILIQSSKKKKLSIHPIFPDSVKEMRWAGHLGVKLKHQLASVIQAHQSTLVFTNTRSQSERWYQELLEIMPEMAGKMAVHHGSLEREIRHWVEDAIHDGKLQLVICTSSLDLGVDFRPVDAVVQIGSPKGVSRFLQRAGRSYHRPDATSRIYFLPTNTMELLEFLALEKAIEDRTFEDRIPYYSSYDVLSQFMVTVALGEGLDPEKLYDEVKSSYCFQWMSREDYQSILRYNTDGGPTLEKQADFKKLVFDIKKRRYYVANRRIAMRHRLSIGAIVSDNMMRVQYINGKFIGMIEERFVTRMNDGDAFVFAGRKFTVASINANVVHVKKSRKKNAIIPSYQGGRMSMSSQLGSLLQEVIHQVSHTDTHSYPNVIKEFIQVQRELSLFPSSDQLLVEYMRSREGLHIYLYPLEGRRVHEILASVIAYRVSRLSPSTFSLAFNDYGFELLTDQRDLDVSELFTHPDLYSLDNLLSDIHKGINVSEMAKRVFRDIAHIGGLIFKGYPGKQKKDRLLQSSTNLIFSMFKNYDEDHFLYQQALQELMDHQIEESRLRTCLDRIGRGKIQISEISRPSPFSLPIMVDRMRETMSSEKLADRLRRMYS